MNTGPDRLDVVVRCQRLLDELDPHETPPATFLGRQFDLGLAWIHFPPDHAGLGVSPGVQSVVDELLGAAGAPDVAASSIIGVGLAAPTIVAHGTEQQRRRLLRPIFTGEEIWCQLFSEPGAGSDVAGLATRAAPDGDEWIVNGQKVWTTLAHVARWGLLVARTDLVAPKHLGLIYFVVDMRASGVEVKPLFQITGEAEFNEVFLIDVRVPDSARLSDAGDGWRVVLTTVMNERVAIGGGIPPRGGGLIAGAVAAWRRADRADASRSRLLELWVEAEVLRLTNLRAQHGRATDDPGPAGSIGKVISARVNQDIAELTLDLQGAAGMLKPGGYPKERPAAAMQWGGGSAADLPPHPSQLARGRHQRDRQEHPRRAGAGAPRRRPSGQGRPVEPDPPILSPAGR